MAKSGKYIQINPGRARLALAIGTAAAVMALASPAYADGFKEAGDKIITQTKAATAVAQKVLITAAVLSLIVGLAPMLWGQVKVKWIISALCACVLFGLAGTMISAFAS